MIRHGVRRPRASLEVGHGLSSSANEDRPHTEEQARLKAVRERFQREKPSLGKLVASGEYTPPIKQAEYWELMKTAAALKKAREEAGISLRQMADRMSMDVAALSRLESSVNANPTIETLFRYAHSLGKNVLVQLVDLPKSTSRKKKPAV